MYTFDGSFTARNLQTGRTHPLALRALIRVRELQKFAPFNFLNDQVRIVIGNDHFALVTFTFKEITGTA